MGKIIPAPLIPWQPSNIALEIQQELDRRKKVRNFDYISNTQAGWDKDGDWKTYKGPMSPWVRVCSNSAGHPAVGKPRFVFYGGKNFYDTYGFKPHGTGGITSQIIGYTPTNPPIPHTIDNGLLPSGGEVRHYPIHVPTPEITRVSVTVQKELYRRAEIEWTCFSYEQLVYMTPYFLVPGISVMLEFGWNHFNPTSLVKLDDEKVMSDLWGNAYPLYFDNIIRSKGNYDVLYGIITNFHWGIEGNKITCMTEITSKDRLYAGISKDMGLTVNDDKSNDRLYAGISKDMGLTVNDDKSNKNENEPRPIYQSLRDFISKDSTLSNLKAIAESPNPSSEIAASSITDNKELIEITKLHGTYWRDIIRPLLNEPDPDVRGLKASYIRGVFTGRQKQFYNSPVKSFTPSQPLKNDFDFSIAGKLDKSKFWINMGMIVEILNYFSKLPGGKGGSMFKVDILNSVIGGHPNLISFNKGVLIPNAKAPKFHFGQVGRSNNTSAEYHNQIRIPTPAESKSDKLLRRVLYQDRTNVCYRNDIDKPINYLRYKFPAMTSKGSINLGYDYSKYSFAFPSDRDFDLPVSPTGLGQPTYPKGPKGNKVEKDVSGLLSNIYLSYDVFEKFIMEDDPKTASYVDLYNKKILPFLNDSVDGFWDLTLVEVDNIMTIVDKNYQGIANKDSNPTYSFDYYDADSIIKSLKFRPQLSDAQATRAIYGETNNADSKYVYVDKNDLMDYKFKDAIILSKDDRKKEDDKIDSEKRETAKRQMRDLIAQIQKLSSDENDDSLQMSISSDGGKTIEFLKLCLPSAVGKQIFRLLIDDKDYAENPRYCAIQPGISLELSIQGCGGLRTFQYFLIKNLPEPYSHRNIIFRIIDVKHLIAHEGNGWDTVITAGILPLRKYITDRLTPPIGGWATDNSNIKN